MPLITDDTGSPMFNLFSTCEGTACYFPSTVMIDHTMKVHHMDSGWSSGSASNYVNEMLDNLYSSLILATFVNISINSSTGDGDQLLNPGETFEITFAVNNNSFDLSANNVQATIQDNSDIVFNENSLDFGNISINGSSSVTISGFVYEDVVLGDNDFILELTAGSDESYFEEVPFTINVTLNQSGFPYDTNSEVKASPAAIDFTNDGSKELIFGDNKNELYFSAEWNHLASKRKITIGNSFRWNRLRLMGGFSRSENVVHSSAGFGVQVGQYRFSYGIIFGSQNLGVPQTLTFHLTLP